MGHHPTPLTFRLARVAHGTRNHMETYEETQLQEEARKYREVLLPGVDIATAYALQGVALTSSRRPQTRVQRLRNIYEVGATIPESVDEDAYQAAFDTASAERGWAVFMHESWRHLHHVVRYFDLIEKDEAPDTSLLEWLVTAGAVTPEVARVTVARFKKKVTQGRHLFTLDPNDAMRLSLAADVREQLEAEQKREREREPA